MKFVQRAVLFFVFPSMITVYAGDPEAHFQEGTSNGGSCITQ